MDAAAHPGGDRDGWFIGRKDVGLRPALERLLLHTQPSTGDVTRLLARIEELEAEVVELRAHAAAGARRQDGHVLFVPTRTGYAIVESAEPPPSADQLLLLDEGWYRVRAVGRSPLPDDRRPCLFLERESSRQQAP